jgi:hypothetical protein
LGLFVGFKTEFLQLQAHSHSCRNGIAPLNTFFMFADIGAGLLQLHGFNKTSAINVNKNYSVKYLF